MFIIFPGNMTTKKHFKLNFVGTKPLKDYNEPKLNNSNFISELKKLGKVHFVEPNYYNLPYYEKWIIDNNLQSFYKKNIDFTIKDLDIEKYCEKVYNELKNFKGKFVLIGHSRGSKWTYTFSQKYPSKCLINFIIDGSYLSPIAIKKSIGINENEWEKLFKSKKFNDIKESDIQDLIKKSKTYDDNAIEKLIEYIHTYVTLNFPKVKKLKVKTISFRHLYIETTFSIYNKRVPKKVKNQNKIDEEEYLLKYNPKNYRTIYFVNKTHFPHAKEDSREIILNTIKSYLL